MSNYPCDPCDCPEAYYRDKESFRKAMLELLCLIEKGVTTPKNRYLVESGGFFYQTEDGTGFYIQE